MVRMNGTLLWLMALVENRHRSYPESPAWLRGKCRHSYR
jgi:hypothetical protein